MSKVKIIFVLGVWVAILPFLGFPYSFKDKLFFITGLVIIYLSYMLYKNMKIEEKVKEEVFDNFSENTDFVEEEQINIIQEHTD